MILPLNNNCLVEIIDENEGIIGSDKLQDMQKGILRSITLVPDHLTASAGYAIDNIADYNTRFEKLIGKTVYWEEYSDTGKKFEQEGKKYSLIPFYRIIGYET